MARTTDKMKDLNELITNPINLIDSVIIFTALSNTNRLRKKRSGLALYQRYEVEPKRLLNQLTRVRSPSRLLMYEVMHCEGEIKSEFKKLDSDTKLKLKLVNAINDFDVAEIRWSLEALGWKEWILPMNYGIACDTGLIESKDLLGWLNFYHHIAEKAIEKDLIKSYEFIDPETLCFTVCTSFTKAAEEFYGN